MKNLFFNFLLLFVLGTVTMCAQTGFVIGTISDGEFNDILPFANVLAKGTTNGTTSDFDGKYSLQLEEGTYTLVFSYLGYQTKEITEVVVEPGKEVVVDITLNPLANQLEEVVVTTTVSKNTEASVLNLQKKSVALIDGLSLQSIKKVGASDIASAVKNVPGVSVQGGKFVFVRGLGDRYTKTLLNGLEVPGLDPDRNTLQLDIFPTNLLDNLIVVKSFTADQSADFTGGIVDIVTKDFPTTEQFNISIGSAYNPDFHFNDNYETFDSGGRAFGFRRSLNNDPITENILTLNVAQNAPELRELTQRFDPQMAAQASTSSIDSNFSIDYGNQFSLNEDSSWRLGFLTALSYRNESAFYENYIDGQVFRRDFRDNTVLELQADRTNQGRLSTNNTLLTGLAGVTLKGERSKYKLNVMHIQNGETSTTFQTQQNFIINSNLIERTALLFTERSITNLSLNGVHTLDTEAKWNLDWKGNITWARVYDQDFRVSPFRVNEDTGERRIEPSEAGDPIRLWRDLEEINYVGKVDLSNKHTLFDNDAKLKVGGTYVFKNRVFDIAQYALPNQDFGAEFSLRFEGDPDQILAPDNILTTNPLQGTFVREDSGASTFFDSDINIAGLYVSEEFKLTPRFTSIIGVRAEQFQLSYTGTSQTQGTLENELILDEFDFFPSANLILELDEEGNRKIRGSYGRTTARPSFKEASIAQIFDPVSGFFFLGNLDIKPTYIDNFDLRFETYGKGTNFFAISGFYKSFENPIELAFIAGATDQFTPRNLGDATVLGAEIEFRSDLSIIGLNNFFFNGNYSLINSTQDLNEDERILRATETNLRVGETPITERQLQGQSPWILNLGLNYNSNDNGWEGGLFYNVQGPTLEIVSDGNIGDVFTRPFNDLKFSIGKSFGQNDQNKITLRISNLLNDERLSEFESFGSTRKTYSLLQPGQSFSVSYSTRF
ncbi:Putative outer membrane protein [Croceitalea dokdonensis DOKDO 023]|uniref:Putative outer membrane protein n=1 Tax=Croceitalea dokdonensis DOKDO 023 TaxID=1300341 RepID=A0A0P7B1A0_9FLAO|nr:TonB-dependent receptor [Croceitalea dokdonensis]KPM32779.1 Putative outer membrane protein [Croceitalea dokdonensis DOKDO 023]